MLRTDGPSKVPTAPPSGIEKGKEKLHACVVDDVHNLTMGDSHVLHGVSSCRSRAGGVRCAPFGQKKNGAGKDHDSEDDSWDSHRQHAEKVKRFEGSDITRRAGRFRIIRRGVWLRAGAPGDFFRQLNGFRSIYGCLQRAAFARRNPYPKSQKIYR